MNLFTTIVNQATRISSEDITELIRFCSGSAMIPHLTFIRVQGGVYRGDLGLAISLAQYMPDPQHEEASSDTAANELADKVILVPRFAILEGTKRKRRPELRLMNVKEEGVNPISLPDNPRIECYERFGWIFLLSRMELMTPKCLGQIAHRVAVGDLSYQELWPFHYTLKKQYLVRRTWELLLAQSWKAGALLHLRTCTPTLADEYVKLVKIDLEAELVIVEASDGNPHILPFLAVERWYQVPDRIRVVGGSENGLIEFVLDTLEADGARILYLSPNLRVKEQIIKKTWVCVVL
jgi:hypothetical protein